MSIALVMHIFKDALWCTAITSMLLLLAMFWFYHSLTSYAVAHDHTTTNPLATEAKVLHRMVNGNQYDLVINPSSWHYQFYQWWRAHTREIPPQPNLCHYFWAVVRTPVIWFFRVPCYRFVRPWMVAAGVLLLVGIVVASYRWPMTMAEVAIAAAIVLAIITLGAGLAVLVEHSSGSISQFLDDHDRGLRIGFLAITFPLWALPIGLLFLYEHFLEPRNLTVRRFCTAHRWYVVYPWSIALVALWCVLSAIFGLQRIALATGVALLYCGIVIASVMVSGLLVIGGVYIGTNIIKPRIQQWRQRRKLQQHAAAMPNATAIQLGVAMIKARKQRICPFISLPYE